MADDTNILPNDQNFVRAAGFESSSTPGLVMAGQIDELTGRILVDNAGGGGAATEITVENEATDTTTFPVFVPGATGDQEPKTNAGLTFNSNTANLQSTILSSSSLTASEIVITDASKNLVSAAVATYPSLTELTYLKGVTGAIQTQLNSKQATITFGTGVQTALGVNIGSAGAPVLFNGALGTPSSGTVTNLTGTASININGTVGATTPTTATITTLTINTSILPDANDGAVLGASGTGFSDLFLASGAVINSAAGTATLTFGSTIASNVDITVPDEVYGSGWNGSLEVPTKNAVYDKIETLSGATAVTLVPLPNYPTNAPVTITWNSNTTGYTAQMVLTAGITVNKISFNVDSTPTDGTVKIGVYSEDGQTKEIDVTSDTLSATGLYTTAVSAVTLSAGVHYVVIVPVSTTSVTVFGHSATSGFSALNPVTSEPKVYGTQVVTAGTLPATFTPSGLTDSTNGFMPFLRFDN